MKLSNLNRIVLFNIAGASYNYLAQDLDGTIKAYTSKPLHDEYDWYPNYLQSGSKEFTFNRAELAKAGATEVDISAYYASHIRIPAWKMEVYKRGEE